MFLGWTVLAIYRLVRAELQLESLPWAWGLFTLFLMGYVAGFLGEGSWQVGQELFLQRLLSAFLITLALAYAAAFSERKDPVVLRRLLQYLGRREWLRALQLFPLWLSTLPFILLTCATLVAVEVSTGSGESVNIAVPAVAMVLFLLRDFGLLLFLNLAGSPKRADMLTMLFLVLLYGVIPMILAALGFDRMTGLFRPMPGIPAEIILPAALLQAAVMLWLMVRRWRRNHLHS